jgi:TonB family protein
MGIPAREIVKLLAEHDPASSEFREGVREAMRASAQVGVPDLDLWKDVFVQQKLPWSSFVESVLIHACALVLVWTLSIAWLRQQRILAPTFDRSSVITYSPEEYLPPLDTGKTEAAKPQLGDPVYARQPILSVPREANNRSQTVVVPPDLKLDHDVPLPNIVATGAVAPIIPLNAIASANRSKAPDPQVVAPAPEVEFARNRITQAALRAEIVPPPTEVPHDTQRDRRNGLSGPESAVVQPPPELSAAKGRATQINIAAGAPVAPAPQLTMEEQHALYGRGHGGGNGFSGQPAQAVAPAPSVPASGASDRRSAQQGRLIALNVNPAAPTGPVAVPSGNRRGSFEAGPQGKAGASGTPTIAASKTPGSGTGIKGRDGSLPAGLHVSAVPGSTSAVQREGASGSNGEGREMASVNAASIAPSGRRAAAAIADDKVTDADREVFGGRRPFGTTLNMPNLNSATGSWVMHFAELATEENKGDLLQPLPTQMSDPGYPLELIRSNVHGKVTLYAVIHSDGGVDGIRVLNTPDERLNAWAVSALAGWKFLPALREGKPVAVEAVVEIPFRARKRF